MRILYGVQATGNGHITRARAMAKALADQGLDVDYLFSGRPADQFFDMEPFGDYRLRLGFSLDIRDGRLRTLGTLRQTAPRQFVREVRELDLAPYDLVITDFEPITAWAARLRRKPSVGIGHQYAFRYPVPRPSGSQHQRVLMRWMAPADIALGVHWHHFDAPLLPPIAPVPEPAQPSDPRLIVVYLPFEAPASIRELLAPIDGHEFAIYHPAADCAAKGDAQLRWHRPSRDGFQADLARCGGVICNAGFELASEALQLGVKLLVKPVRGQSEQQANAMALAQLGFAATMDTLDRRKVLNWLAAETVVRVRYPNVAAAVASWIAAGHDPDIQPLSAALWRATRFPEAMTGGIAELDGVVSEP